VKENIKGRTKVRSADAKNEEVISSQWEGEKAVSKVTSGDKLTELPGKNDIRTEEGRPFEELATDEKI
jgi:hypothetical protein